MIPSSKSCLKKHSIINWIVRFTLLTGLGFITILACFGLIFSRDIMHRWMLTTPEYTINSIKASTSLSQVEQRLHKSSIDYEYTIPTIKDMSKGSVLLKSNIPFSRMRGLITVVTPIEQTTSCVSYQRVFVLIFDKNKNFMEFVNEESCVERIF